MTLKLTLALVMAFITAVIVGKFLCTLAKKNESGQEIKENGPTWHMSKVRNADYGRRHLHKRMYARVSDCRF